MNSNMRCIIYLQYNSVFSLVMGFFFPETCTFFICEKLQLCWTGDVLV